MCASSRRSAGRHEVDDHKQVQGAVEAVVMSLWSLVDMAVERVRDECNGSARAIKQVDELLCFMLDIVKPSRVQR